MTIPADRLVRACDLLTKANIDAVVLVPGSNFSYLTGVQMHLMERPTLFALTCDGGKFAVMPALERQKWAAAMPDAETFYWEDADGPNAAFVALAGAVGTRNTLGIEGLRMRAAEYLALRKHWPVERLCDADGALTGLRLLKDATEIAELRRAIAISEAALGETYDNGIGGRTEAEIAGQLKAAMLAHGATGFAFEPIVLTGGAAADPHGDAGARAVKPGDALLIDFGASYGSMHADITRTVFCGHASDDHAALYETVRAANAAGRKATYPGNAVGDIDAAATDVLAASPYADLILHKTGHGLGRDVHEAPQVMRSNRAPLQKGMVITIEPGLYRAGDIGVRIEDDVVVTETGYDCLTQFPRELSAYD
ncbi:Xaa-Pro peptidase family protein [Yoonia sp. F2084L]|uniref:M24 family metallopeptidase n=1 Tax=Yoonia sp. F2084L TaxID=2926419 RepID=UPI001FF1E615|nr:Xaa-Pro peptidase family protein [Yoonia sp. F2084L]MCK0096715.1 Xaa-Pro peptidase family protein [Yoonia sp. F2084L]